MSRTREFNYGVNRSSPTASDALLLPLHAAMLLLRTRGLKRYAVLPLLVNLVLYVLAAMAAFYLIWRWDLSVPSWDFLWSTGALLSKVLNWVLATLKWAVGIPLILLVCYFTFTAAGMIVASPFNDMLSARVEQVVCEPTQRPSVPIGVNTRAAVLSVLDAMWIVMKQLFFMAMALPFLLIPVVGFVPLFLVTAYFTGVAVVDTSMARNYLRTRHKMPMIRLHRWRVLLLGLAVEVLFLIPFAGLLILPLGVTAGTMMYCGWDWKALLESSRQEPPTGFVAPRMRCEPASTSGVRSESSAKERPDAPGSDR